MRVVVADGNPIVRLSLKALLLPTGMCVVVGEEGDGEEALRLVEELRPDLMILGPHLTVDRLLQSFGAAGGQEG